MANVPYREAIGALMYLCIATRPDIAYAVTLLARFSNSPGRTHWEAVKQIFRYLVGTKHMALTYGMTSGGLIGYTDADGMSQPDRRAISGYAFLYNGGAVSWSSKHQELVALSTTEAEYVAATHAAKEAMWIHSFLSDLFGDSSPTTLFCDNQSAISLAHNDQFHARTKHIDIRFHFIRWIVEEGKIKLLYCPTDSQVADVLTKALPSTKAKHFASLFGLRLA